EMALERPLGAFEGGRVRVALAQERAGGEERRGLDRRYLRVGEAGLLVQQIDRERGEADVVEERGHPEIVPAALGHPETRTEGDGEDGDIGGVIAPVRSAARLG